MSISRLALQLFGYKGAGDTPTGARISDDADENLLVRDDNANAALGESTDAEAAGDGSIIAVLKRIRSQQLADNHQVTVSNSGLTDAELRASALPKSRASTLPFAEVSDGEELLLEDVAAGHLYIGAATSGTATATAAWDVCRWERTAAGAVIGQKIQTGIAWDNRASGW